VLRGSFIWFGRLGNCDRLTQIECYLRSDWNVCPLAKFKKKPIFTKEFWRRLSIDQKLDTFYHDPDLGVGLWIDDRYEIFDFDGDSEPREDTLVSVRGADLTHSHAFFEASGEIYNTVKKVAPNIDTRASTGLAVLPPTRHESGDLYRWYNLGAPISIPDALMLLWRQRKTTGKKTGFSLYQLPDEIQYGERNSTLWSFGRSLRAAGADREHIARRIRQANLELCKPPFPPKEIERQIAHIWSHKNDPDRWQGEQSEHERG
jgi:hypothetical protein